jgi:hypothetical protein
MKKKISESKINMHKQMAMGGKPTVSGPAKKNKKGKKGK